MSLHRSVHTIIQWNVAKRTSDPLWRPPYLSTKRNTPPLACFFLHHVGSPCPAKRYTKDHEYVILDDATNIGTVGITDYAQQALGDVVFVELPGVDTEVAAEGESTIPFLTRESVMEQY